MFTCWKKSHIPILNQGFFISGCPCNGFEARSSIHSEFRLSNWCDSSKRAAEIPWLRRWLLPSRQFFSTSLHHTVYMVYFQRCSHYERTLPPSMARTEKGGIYEGSSLKNPDFGKEGCSKNLPPLPLTLSNLSALTQPLGMIRLAKIWVGSWLSCWNSRGNLLGTQIHLQFKQSIKSQCQVYPIRTLVKFLPQSSLWWSWASCWESYL